MSASQYLGLEIGRGTVQPEWIDQNNHMNVAYYVLAFDLCVDDLWRQFGITDEYIELEKCSTFAVESHITYQRELTLGQPYCVTAQILAIDEKRIHQFQRMYHAEQHYLAATCEWMNLHVDLERRRVSPWPPAVLGKLQMLARSHAHIDYPAEAGRRIQIRQPINSD